MRTQRKKTCNFIHTYPLLTHTHIHTHAHTRTHPHSPHKTTTHIKYLDILLLIKVGVVRVRPQYHCVVVNTWFGRCRELELHLKPTHFLPVRFLWETHLTWVQLKATATGPFQVLSNRQWMQHSLFTYCEGEYGGNVKQFSQCWQGSLPNFCSLPNCLAAQE